jgi:hypothetical protein
MDNCSLYPPNHQSLTGDVIGNVVQRAWAAPRLVHDDTLHVTADAGSLRESGACPPAGEPMDAPIAVPSLHTKKINITIGRKRSLLPTTDSAHQSSIVTMLALTVQKHEQNLAHHRERRRMNQVRYRQKQRNLEKQLERDIHDLELRRHSASIGAPTQQTLWTFATEYFRLFQCGLGSPFPALQAVALNFLRASMAPDVMNGNVCGPEALMTQWKVFSQCFTDIHVDLERLEKGATGDSLVATTSTSVTITEATLQAAFPHLRSDGADGEKWTPLARKLVNQRLVLRGWVRFDWDSVRGRVSRMQSHSDLLTPILQLVGTLENVSRVFVGAFVTPDGQMNPPPQQ